MSEEILAKQTALAKYSMSLASRAIHSLVARSGTDEELLRGSLDVMHRTQALSPQDPISEHVAVTLIRAALDQVRAEEAERKQ
jgi:precorrin-6B methylase 1